MAELRTRTIHANGLDFCIGECGPMDGPPVVLIMGLACQMTHWPTTLLEALAARGYRVLCFDNRDVGLSEKTRSLLRVDTRLAFLTHRLGLLPRVNYTLFDMAADTAALITALQASPAHVVGISMGGMIGQILAARYPKLVQSLTLIMTSNNDPRLPMPELRLIWKLAQARPRAGEDDAVIRRWMGFWKAIRSPGYPHDEGRLRQLVIDTYRRSYSPGGTLRQLQAILGTGSLEGLCKAVDCPVRIIHGDRDPLIRPAAARALQRCIPGARLTLFPGMGHDLPEPLIPRVAALIHANALEGRIHEPQVDETTLGRAHA